LAVIKQSQAREVLHHADVFDFADVKQQAQQLIDAAQQQATEIVQAARHEAGRLTSGAAEAGYARGLEQGLNEGRERGQREGFESTVKELKPKLEATLAAWNDALDRWESERTCMFLEARRDVLELALKLARKVVHRHIELEPEIVSDQLAAALMYVGKTSSLLVSIHPRDREMLDRTLAPILERLGRAEHVTLREDESLARGGCVIRTEGGRVDASIETQLRRLTESLLPGATDAQPEMRADDDTAADGDA
jgi:flagellar assembly protein FliH